MFLSKKPNGYYYLYYHDDIKAKRVSISTKSKVKSEANKFLINFKNFQKNKLAASLNFLNKDITISQFQTEVINHAQKYLSNSSISIYKQCFKNLLNIVGDKSLKLITQKDFEIYIDNRLLIVNKTTINIEIKTIKAIFNIADKWGIFEREKLSNIKKFKIEQKPRLFFTENEINSIIQNLDTEIKNIVLVGLYTGCRISEIINIQWKDINFAENILSISNKDNFKTKTRKNRKIPLSNKLLEILNQLYERETSDYSITDFDLMERFIFRNRLDKKFERSNVTKKFKKTLRKLNFPEKYHFHCLRHTFITTLARKGVNLYDIKELAGHSDIQTTEIYLHSVTEDLRNAVNKI